MTDKYTRGLELNIGKYSWFKVFTKRVYLPLIIIFLADNGVSAQQIGFIALASTIMSIILQIPTGYLADKWGARSVITFGSFIAAISPIFLVIMPNFYGGLIADLLFWAAFSFHSGAIEAFMHDTLIELGKEKEYTKVMGKAQSYGLIGNVVLIILVPLTYTIDKRIPFALGALSLFVNFWIALNFTYPKHKIIVKRPNPVEAFKLIMTPSNISTFLLVGAIAAIVFRGQEFRELVFAEVGIPVAYYGTILAASSLLAAVLGRHLHFADRMSANKYYFLNVIGMALVFIGIGATRNPYIIVTCFVVMLAYARVQSIVITSKLLESVKHAYKSTLLSSIGMVDVVERIWVISLLTSLVTTQGYVTGYFNFGIIVGIVGLLLLAVHLIVHRKYAPVEG